MSRHLLVVEGAHDAALFGRLLVARGFQSLSTLEAVPRFWEPTIPRRYPIRDDLRLDRVISFPEIYRRNDSEVGIAVANGESELLRTLRSLLDMLDAPDFDSIAVILDTDWAQTEAERFAEFRASTAEWNDKAVADGRPGFPLTFPNEANSVTAGPLKVGVYQFPGGGAGGALEDVLLACAQHSHPILRQAADDLVLQIHAEYPADAAPDPMKASRKQSGSAKARCGIIANVLQPGHSLAVSIRKTPWLPNVEADVPAVASVAQFLDELLAN